ncbi:hypothetical protein ACGFIV_05455 [Sphaerisporangium sp. NPDC049003]|uniref:hypothetical protein n=1 Tax=Sphaerisporangium sp. NPDC049003 TaxID=3364517 RepID=UPI00371A7A6E
MTTIGSIRAVLLSAVVVAGLSGADTVQVVPTLVEPGDTSGFGTGMWKSTPRQPYLFGDMPVCLDRPGTVMVTNVGFERPRGGIRLEAFALRPRYTPAYSNGTGGGEPSTLRRKGIATGPQPITEVCPPPEEEIPRFAELVVQVSRTGKATASGTALNLTYTSAGHVRTLRIPVELVICGQDKAMDCD